MGELWGGGGRVIAPENKPDEDAKNREKQNDVLREANAATKSMLKAAVQFVQAWRGPIARAGVV